MTGERRGLWLLGLVAAVLVPPTHAVAQGASSEVLARPGRELVDSVAVLVVSERPWTPTVAVVVSFVGGSGDDPNGGEGASWLLGMVLTEMARAELAGMGARVQIDVEPARTLVTMLASPEDWEVAYRTLMETLSVQDVAPSAVDAAREDLLAQLAFQRGAPVRTFELETERLLLGAFHPFARAPAGSAESINGLGVGTLVQMRHRVFDPQHAAVAVVGAIRVDAVAAALPSGRTIGPLPGSPPGYSGTSSGMQAGDSATSSVAASAALSGAVPETQERGETEASGTGSKRAWTEGERHTVADDVTNSWIVAAYPFSSDAPRTDFEFLSYSLERELSPDPPPPGLFHLSAEVRDLPDGPVVLVIATVETRTAPTWERRIVNATDRLAANVMSPMFFDRHRRSFRSATAIRLAAPEEEAHRILADAQRLGWLRDVAADIGLLSRNRLQRIASMLGEPRVLVFGPGRSRGGHE